MLRTFLPIIVVSVAVHAATAAEAPAAGTPGAGAAAGLMHANLVVPAQPVPAAARAESQAATLHAGLQQDRPAAAAQDGPDRDGATTAAMLLAALALMAGIALRRWETGSP